MQSYGDFAAYYDRAMGDRDGDAAFIRKLLRTYSPAATHILEIGCGTGTILKSLADEGLQVTGIDASEEMLAIAREKLPGARLERQDLRDFSLGESYDAVLCLFDTINHLLSFDAWRSVFSRASTHLRDGGVFIFDINTTAKLTRLAHSEPYVKEFSDKMLTLQVTADGATYNWRTEVAEKTPTGPQVLVAETIQETSFPQDHVTDALREYFSEVQSFDAHEAPPLDTTERIFFVCTK